MEDESVRRAQALPDNAIACPTIYLVIPCYNEEAVLPITAPMFVDYLDGLIGSESISPASRICFVDDGSSDRTWNQIVDLAQEHEIVRGIKLSRNSGHQNALLAGLEDVRRHCDAAITIDCDGQDDIHAIGEMISQFKEGNEIVYGVRSSRKSDSFFKRFTAEGYYKVLKALGVETVFNHADYRLMSSRALDELSKYKEANVYLRGIVPLIGLKTTTVEYERAKREAGVTHYQFRKMLHLAVDGITSLTSRPLHIIAFLGVVFSLVGLAGVIWALIQVAMHNAIAGWASTICFICLLGGLQLISLGVIGEYIGKIYYEVKARPRYMVEKRTWEADSGRSVDGD